MSRFETFDLERAVTRRGSLHWQKLMQLSVRLSRLRSRPSLQRGNEILVLSHQARLRRIADIVPGMRFRQGQRVLIIHDVETIGHRQAWLSCLCEEQRGMAPSEMETIT